MIRYKKIDETKKLKEKLDDFLIEEYMNFKVVKKKEKVWNIISIYYMKKIYLIIAKIMKIKY